MSTEIAHEGILLSIKQEDISVLPNLFVQFGQSLSMLADRDPVQQNQVLEYYTNALDPLLYGTPNLPQLTSVINILHNNYY